MNGRFSKPLREIHGVRFNDSERNIAEKIAESYDNEVEHIESQTEFIPLCVHGHAIRNVQEMGGRCICGALLCTECAHVQCVLDRRILCGAHAKEVNGYIVCSTHTFVERLVLRLKTSRQRELP